MIKANIVLDKKIWEKKIKKPEIYFKKKLNKLSKLSAFKNKNQDGPFICLIKLYDQSASL